MSITPSPSSANLQSLLPTTTKHKDPPYYLIKLLSICALWYLSSAANSIVLKRCLTIFPFPITLTFVQFIGCSVFTFPLLKFMQVAGAFRLAKGLLITAIIPLTLGKVVAVFFATVSIRHIPVSYSNTVKASLPLFSVLFSRCLLGERHSKSIYFCLFFIISGVVISSCTELLFDIVGLISALTSTVSTALLNVYAKKSMTDHKLHYMKMLYFVSCSSVVCMTPIWLIMDVSRLITFDYSTIDSPVNTILTGMFIVSVSNFLQNAAAFGFLNMVNPVSYAVANCTKRIFIIGTSLLMLHNPVTMTNVGGMFTAIFGVACYNKVKYDEQMRKKQLLAAPVLPLTTSPYAPVLPLTSSPYDTPTPHQINSEFIPRSKSHVALLLNGYKSYDKSYPRTSKVNNKHLTVPTVTNSDTSLWIA